MTVMGMAGYKPTPPCPHCESFGCYCEVPCAFCGDPVGPGFVIDGHLYMHGACRPKDTSDPYADSKLPRVSIDAADGTPGLTFDTLYALEQNMSDGIYMVPVSKIELDALRQVAALLRRLYEGNMHPWERYLVQQELEGSLALIPVNDHDAAVADLVKLSEELT